MGFFYILWRRTALLALGPRSPDVDALSGFLVFPLQLFDDIFTDIIFLTVKPFSALFFLLVIFHIVRDTFRDAGLYGRIYRFVRRQCGCRTEPDSAGKLLYRYHLAKQNMLSELLSVLVVPLCVAYDLFYTYVGYGVNTITRGLTQIKRVEALQMYGVLFLAETLNHKLIQYLLKKQLHSYRAGLSQQSIVNIAPKETEERKRNRRLSVSVVDRQWDIIAHDIKYWR